MKLEADQRVLAEAVGWVAKHLPHRPSTPILLGVRLAATAAGVAVAGTDHAVAIRTAVPCQVAETGACVVPGRMLAEVIRLLPEGAVSVSADEHAVTLRSGTAVYNLPVLPLADHPGEPALPDDVCAQVRSDDFADAVARTVVSAARDDVVPAFAGIKLSFADEFVELACTDRYRLTVVRLPLLDPIARPFDVLVPAKPLADLTRAFAADGEIVELSGDVAEEDATFALRNPVRQAVLRTLAGTYPPYHRFVPAEPTTELLVDRVQLRDALRRLAVVADGATPVHLAFDSDVLRVHISTGTGPTGTEHLTLPGPVEPITVAFTPTVLLDALNALDTPTVRIALAAPRKPAVLTPSTAGTATAQLHQHVLMPRLLP